MSDSNKKQSQAKAESTDAGTEQLQQAFDKANEQGFFGESSDPTPNEHYTVDGVTNDKPTPETDEKAAAKAREARNG